jgi:glycerophosphoryl diester phosphodiesterase
MPENTLESFRLAFCEHAADMIEFDVHLSRDGIPVVIHDETLERTTNGQGFVANKTFAELKSLNAGYGFDPEKNFSFPTRDRQIRIPSLEEVFQNFLINGSPLKSKPLRQDSSRKSWISLKNSTR